MTSPKQAYREQAYRELPYAELPHLPGTDVAHSWDVFPVSAAGTQGTLNRLTDAVCAAALKEARTGRRIGLSLPLDQPDPPLFSRAAHDHRVFQRNRNMIEDVVDGLDLQASSQWDALRHIAAREHGAYGGVTDWESPAAKALGIDAMARIGVVARAVLLDFAGHDSKSGHPTDGFEPHVITVDELRATIQAQGSLLRPGDLLLVRTGWLAALRKHGGAHVVDGVPVGAGLDSGPEMAAFLWDSGLCAVAADNPAVEVLPNDPARGSLHRRLIAGLGMPLGELWDLDELAAASQETGRYECLVTAVPLNLPGGVGSPANALAIL